MPVILDVLTDSLHFFSFAFLLAVLLTIFDRTVKRKAALGEWPALLAVHLPAAALSRFFATHGWEFLVPLGVNAVAYLLVRPLMRPFRPSGRLLFLTNTLFIVSSLAWGIAFAAGLEISLPTRLLLFASYPLLILSLPIGVVAMIEQWEVLAREHWLRPRTIRPLGQREEYPRVCLQVPCYAEPPEVVIQTLDRLAALDYPNFEVMVIDNNTKDPELWKPLEAHCERLGERFRFFHVDPLAGAKAGALNFALRHTPSEVEIVGVIDADYHAEADFLSALLGHFDDPRMGFVQTPHDYRDWQRSPYQRLCYWEYKTFFATTMPSLNEKDAGLTVGTMCLIRRRALEEAGGWSEWCQTEDSELAIRIHAAGYTSVYVPQTFGRGLIPETFAGYKKQRFRWTYGPVQEFKHHLKLFLPGRWAEPSALRPLQKLHHMNHGLGPFTTGLNFLLLPVMLAVVASMVIHHEVIAAPPTLWLASSTSLVGSWLLSWLIYRSEIGCSLRDALGAMLAKQALSHTMIMASVRGLFTDRIPWRRTNKFKSLPSGLQALASVKAELLLGLGCLGLGCVLALHQRPGSLAHMLGLGFILQSFAYLPAPLLALIAEGEIQKAHRPLVVRRPAWQLSGRALAGSALGGVAAAALVALGLQAPANQPARTALPVQKARPATTAQIQPRIATAVAGTPEHPPLAAHTFREPGRDIVAALPQRSAPPAPAAQRAEARRSAPLATGQNPQKVAAPPGGEPEQTQPADAELALIPAEEPTTAIQLLAVTTPAVPNCYDPQLKARDYRCFNRKN